MWTISTKEKEMSGFNKCDTCHWIGRDGRCCNNDSPHGRNRDYVSANDSCLEYMMDPQLRRNLEVQQEREKEERKRREREQWLASEEGQKWQAEEKRKQEEERKERERKEREHQEWLKTDEGQKWQAEEEQKEEDRKSLERKLKIEQYHKEVKKEILIGSFITTTIGIVGTILIALFNNMSFNSGEFLSMLGVFIWMGFGIGGNIIFIPGLFLKPFEWEMFFASGCITIILWLPCFLILRVVFPLVFVFAGLIAFAIAGPIWPLIRILMKKNNYLKGV
jgi:cation transport ATPase